MKNISLVDPIDKEYNEIVDKIYNLKGCKYITALPDAGMSNHETPYGIATAFEGYIVPQLLGRIIGCGMALLKINVEPYEIIDNRDKIVTNIAYDINKKKDDIIIGRGMLEKIYRNGPNSILPYFPELENKVNSEILKPVDLSPLLHELHNIADIIPPWTLKNNERFYFPGQSINKNHFIEFYKNYTDKRFLKLNEKYPNCSFCAYHFESPLSIGINEAYSGSRRKERDNNKLMKFRTWIKYLKKIKFHLKVEGVKNFNTTYHSFLRHVDFTPIPLDTLSGQRYLSTVQLQVNYERTARLIFASILIKSLQKTLKKDFDWEVLFEGDHNSFDVEEINNKNLIVSRKNLVRADKCKLGFIAGMYNMPSIVVESINKDSSLRWMNSYDHGIGNHLWRESGSLEERTDMKDVSQYEKIYRRQGNQNVNINIDNEHINDVCSIYRYNINKKDFDQEDCRVKSGKTIEHVLKVYNKNDTPVRVIGLLSPIINYKEVKDKSNIKNRVINKMSKLNDKKIRKII